MEVDIRQLIEKEEYNFLKETDKDLIFLTLGGSHAYGTNVEGSDVDIRGVAFNTYSNILGMEEDYEQIVDLSTDTTVYSLKKAIKLLISNNPNALEIIGTREKDVIIYDEIGEEIIKHKNSFLSQKCIQTFEGYANAQLRRLMASLAREYPQVEKEQHILESIKHAMYSFDSRYKNFENGSVNVYKDKAENPELEEEIFVDVNLKHYPLRDYKSMWNDMHNIVKDYEKINHRNKKKDDEHLNKHIMHLCRLKLMLMEILKEGNISTYRADEIPLLLDIRRGLFVTKDRKLSPDFFDWITDTNKKIEALMANTKLPEAPDYDTIEKILIMGNKKIIKKKESGL